MRRQCSCCRSPAVRDRCFSVRLRRRSALRRRHPAVPKGRAFRGASFPSLDGALSAASAGRAARTCGIVLGCAAAWKGGDVRVDGVAVDFLAFVLYINNVYSVIPPWRRGKPVVQTRQACGVSASSLRRIRRRTEPPLWHFRSPVRRGVRLREFGLSPNVDNFGRIGDNPADRTGPIAKKFFLSDKNFTQLRAFMASDPCACGRAFPYKLIE